MILKIIIDRILGYVKIRIEGFYIERFINICKSKNILLWGIKRKKASVLFANISIKRFREIKDVANKTKCKIHIERKKGIPFFLNKYKKRKIFLILAIIIFGTIIMASQFVWNIEIKGNNEISEQELLDELNKEGLEIGKLKNKVDTKAIINNMRLNRSDISWIGINLKGTNVIVEIVESKVKPEVIDENEYCNIVAEKSGVIQKIDATNGTAQVKQGDVVKEGNILIGGWIEGKYTGIRYVHASGNIIMKTWYSAKEKVYLQENKKEKTGDEEKKYKIKINNFEINLYKTLSKFEKYDTIYSSKKVKIFSDFYLPIELVECNNIEIKEEDIIYEKEEAKNIAIQKAEEKLKEQINIENITNRTVNFYENEGYVEVEVIYEVLENIGTKEKIVF